MTAVPTRPEQMVSSIAELNSLMGIPTFTGTVTGIPEEVAKLQASIANLKATLRLAGRLSIETRVFLGCSVGAASPRALREALEAYDNHVMTQVVSPDIPTLP